MTNQFAQPFQNLVGIGGFDYQTAGTQPSEKGTVPAQKNTLRLWDQGGDPPNIGRGEIIINDFSLQGANHPEGDFSRHSNGFAWSDFLTGFPNEMVPSNWTTQATSPTPTGNIVGLHGAYVFDTAFFAAGGGANVALYKETSTTDATPAAITYSPAAEICSLSVTLASGAARLAVGHVGAAVKLMSDASGTVASTMHTSTNSCWGIIMSGLNATTPGTPVLLMYCGTTIGTKASDADMTTAITTTQTGLNAGGFAIGAIKAAGRAQRAYWAMPKVTNTAGALKYGAEALMVVWSTDMAGGDLIPHKLNYLPDGIKGAIPYRDGFVAWDDTHIIYWDGDDEYDLGIFRARTGTRTTTNTINPDYRQRIRAARAEGPALYVLWQTFYQPTGTAGQVFVEFYNFESGTWHNKERVDTLTSTAASVSIALCGSGGMPFSLNTRAAYVRNHADGRWRYCFIPRAAESMLWQNSQGSGTSSNFPYTSYSNSNMLGCRWWLDAEPPGALPGHSTIKRAPKVITDVEFGGDLDYGENATLGETKIWSFTVKVQGRGLDGTTTYTAYNQTFSQGQPSSHYIRKNPVTARANIQDVQLYLTVTSSYTGAPTVAPTAVQCLPFTIRFAYSKDGKPITSLPEDTR